MMMMLPYYVTNKCETKEPLLAINRTFVIIKKEYAC